MSTVGLAASSPAVTASAATGLPFTPDALMNGTVALVAVFLGAMLAFIFQLLFQRSQERKAERLAAHRILFCLLQQANTILLLQRDLVSPHATSPIQFLNIPATQDFDITKNLFDFASFGFLLKASDGRKLMYDLYLAQESYVETLRTLNERSRFHRQELQPRAAAAGIGTGKPITIGELQNLLGPLVYGTMVNTTNQLLSLMQDTFQKLDSVKTAFRAYAVQHFKSNDFTEFAFEETYGLRKPAE